MTIPEQHGGEGQGEQDHDCDLNKGGRFAGVFIEGVHGVRF